MIGSQEDMVLVAQAGTATDAMKEFRLHRPDVTLMDLRLPKANGTDALIAIHGEFPQEFISPSTPDNYSAFAPLNRDFMYSVASYDVVYRWKFSSNF